MDAGIKIGKVWGIPIGLHTTWFLIFAFLTWSLAAGYFPSEYPQLSTAMHWLLGLVTSLLFFGSVLAHELGHAWVALRNSIPVKHITLFIFGGVAMIGREPRTPGAEFRIAIAGPLVSFGLAIFFSLLWLLDAAIPWLAAPSLYLARINWILALFNLIPGFPLDGGRILRAIVWKLTGSMHRATRVAGFTGQVFAYGFIALGLVMVFGGNLWNGVWMAFIGWFLLNAASSARNYTNMQELLQDVKVSQVMARNCTPVTGLVPLSTLVQEQVIGDGQRCFFVTEGEDVRGTLTLREITRVPQRQWPFTTTAQAMAPVDTRNWVEPGTELLAALQLMEETEQVELPVVENQKLVGLLSRENITNYLQARSELGV